MRTETVTEETSRSTGEAFSNRQAARREEDEGLSNLQTFALGALGVAAFSAILNRDEEVVASAEDRVVVRDDTDSYRVLKNDDALLRQPGSQVQTQTFSDGSSLSTYLREDGQQVRTIRAANGQVLRRSVIRENPGEVFQIEGHTDAVGSASMNLTLSDRRAESAALALTEFFDIPPEHLVVHGYGEANLKIVTQEAQRQNRRVAVRRITPLLQTAAR